MGAAAHNNSDDELREPDQQYAPVTTEFAGYTPTQAHGSAAAPQNKLQGSVPAHVLPAPYHAVSASRKCGRPEHDDAGKVQLSQTGEGAAGSVSRSWYTTLAFHQALNKVLPNVKYSPTRHLLP